MASWRAKQILSKIMRHMIRMKVMMRMMRVKIRMKNVMLGMKNVMIRKTKNDNDRGWTLMSFQTPLMLILPLRLT